MKLTKEERDRIPDASRREQELSKTCDALEAEIAALKADLEASRKVNRAVLDVKNIDEGQLYSEIARLCNEIISLREPMSCGDPKACWISTIPVLPPELQIGPIVTDQTKPSGCCTACERRKLEVAAALRKAASVAANRCTTGVEAHHAILAFIPGSDASALDAYVQEKVDKALPDRNLVRSALYELMGYLGISYLSDGYVEAVYSRLAANRAKARKHA